MMLPILRGVVRRRLLINYRVDADAVRGWLPAPFEPKLHRGWAVTGVCLIRMEQLPLRMVPLRRGLGSENAAHRVAVRWRDGEELHEGVYVHRSDCQSLFNPLARARIFPGEPRRARFHVEDDGKVIRLSMRSADGRAEVEIAGHASAAMSPASIFSSIRDASDFFESGSLGYAPAREGRRYEGMMEQRRDWAVHPLSVSHVRCSIFEDELFPRGSVEFDHALVMRDVEAVWKGAPDLAGDRSRTVSEQPASNR